MKQLLFYLKVSRPGLWFPTIWLYMLPFGGHQFWVEPMFWLGLLYVTFPLNFLIYGWNDIVDYETETASCLEQKEQKTNSPNCHRQLLKYSYFSA